MGVDDFAGAGGIAGVAPPQRAVQRGFVLQRVRQTGGINVNAHTVRNNNGIGKGRIAGNRNNGRPGLPRFMSKVHTAAARVLGNGVAKNLRRRRISLSCSFY